MALKLESALIGMIGAALMVPVPNLLAAGPSGGVTTQMVITLPSATATLQASDVTVQQGKTSVPVDGLQRLAGEMADMQLFVLLDDSTRSASLGTQIPELKSFLVSLPASTQVAVGYMRNGTFELAQPFTAEHQKAAGAVRLPTAIPGENGSPYFALSDLVKHWPSKQSTDRRTVLMLTDGVDRYYNLTSVDDPYVDTAVKDALKSGVAVYSVYLRGAGDRDWGGRGTNLAQSRLLELSDETGGYAYYQGFGDPVSVSPFLKDFRHRLDNQYKLTFQAKNEHGVQAVKLRTELPSVKIDSPSRVFIQ
jgi:hypothetical protein